jgi:hypothetical protein
LDFSGLQNGPYQLWTYCLGRQDFPVGMTVIANNDVNNGQALTGVFGGSLELGSTHSVHEVNVIDGALRVTIDSGGRDPFVNGLQLVRVPEPSSVLLGLLALTTTWRLRVARR